jgi:hypothetical protein
MPENDEGERPGQHFKAAPSVPIADDMLFDGGKRRCGSCRSIVGTGRKRSFGNKRKIIKNRLAVTGSGNR